MAALSDAVADELYRVAPRDFTASRDARAVRARAAGDRQLAKEIKGLRRPTTSAWMANWLSRECRVQLGQLFDLGDALRAAQDRLDGPELRRLSRLRQEGVVALCGHARVAARATEIAVNEEALRELGETLNAGVTDPQAAAAVMAGRLSAPLHHSGFGLPDMSNSPSDSAPSAAPQAEQAAPTVAPDVGPEGDPDHERHLAEVSAAAERRDRLEAAESALRHAESEAADARQRLDVAQARVAEMQQRSDALRRSISGLEARLNTLRSREELLSDELDSGLQALRSSGEASNTARQRLVDCRRSVERQRDGAP